MLYPPPGDLPNPQIEPRDQTQVSPTEGRFFTTEPAAKPSVGLGSAEVTQGRRGVGSFGPLGLGAFELFTLFLKAQEGGPGV